VIFGSGTLARLREDVEREGGGAGGTAWQSGRSQVRCGQPIEIADRAMAFIADKGIDGLIAVGGGSRPHQ
jgi:hypothetical protein